MNSMEQHVRQHHCITTVIAILIFSWTLYGQPQNTPPPTPDEEQPEVLTRGPVHEAFAEPVSMQNEEGLIAPDEPPPSIAEVPPPERPVGDDYVWVPGYWSWDGERKSHIWVSACWRSAPPHRTWVPGYWSQVSRGWEWVPGFWAPADIQEIEYLPAPPQTEAVEPPGPPPHEADVWVPPCWYWSEGHYIPRRGYWLASQPNWIWVPSHYAWTPRGYVFVEGHWDYTLENRGLLFAPVHIPRAAYIRRGFTYSPSVVIDIGALSVNLFVAPRYCHYYFGDYYDDVYIQAGIHPWFERTRTVVYYDPIFEYHRAIYRRTEPRWEDRVRRDYEERRTNKDLRPPRTYRELETRVAKAPEAQRQNIQVVQKLSVVVNNSTKNVTNVRTGERNVTKTAAPLKFEKINTETQTKIAKQVADVHKFRDERKNLESAAAAKEPRKTPVPKEQVTPPAKQPEPERKTAAKEPEAERKTATKEPSAVKPAERKESEAQPAERKPPVTARREVRAEQPEKVKISAPPLSDKSKTPRAAEKGPPPKPESEAKHKDDAKDKDAPKKDDKPDKKNE